MILISRFKGSTFSMRKCKHILINRLEKLRRREEQERGLEVEDDQAEPDSAESSVEGIYVSGVRAHHPFKV